MRAGDVVADRFTIEHEAGSGGMGTVYRARDRDGRAIALKVLQAADAEGAARFAREASVLAELHHPGIVGYVAHGETREKVPFLAMDWIEGEDLYGRLARAPLTTAESLIVVRGVAEALGAAHRRGIVHRDIKPTNILLEGRDIERVKVVDFGIARVGFLGNERRATRTGIVIGTPGYMAPEQARGDSVIDARADVFALGCLLFECLTGESAFVGEHPMAVMLKVVLEDARRVREVRRDVPEAVDRLVTRLLAKDREQRPVDGAAVAEELCALADRAPSSSIAASIGPRSQLTPRSIGGGEQRVLSVILIDAASSSVVPDARTLTPSQVSAPLETIAAAVDGLGARVEPLAGGHAVAMLSETGPATDQAARAARCALAIREALPGAPLAVATGRGAYGQRLPLGEVIERAVSLLRRPGALVRIDEVTAGLLDSRFEVSGDAHGLRLIAERGVVDATRTVLGRATPCVGRDRELGLLQGAVNECLAEPRAIAVAITGAAGIGKSRLRHEVLRTAPERGFEIWIGRGDAVSPGSPFGVLAPAIRRAAGARDGEDNTTRRRKLRARFARNLSGDVLERVTTFLSELCGARAEGDEDVRLRAARRDAMLMGDQMLRAFTEWVVAETSQRPILFVIEDLHWGDLPSVRFLDAALRAAHDRPFMVLALARPEVDTLFPNLWSERGAMEIRLGELTKKGSEKLVRAILPEAEPALVASLIERASGNAFYLEELVRAVASGDRELPETVLAMVQARLARVPQHTRRVLRAASVFGQVFWRGGVATLVGDDVDAALEDLISEEVIARLGVPRFPREQELSFRHALLREGAYSMLTEEDRCLGHRMAAEWLEQSGERDAIALAEHFERGGEQARSVEWFLLAAEQALEGNDLGAAIARSQRGIDAGAAGQTLGALYLVQAEAHNWRGEHARGAETAGSALEVLPEGSARWCRAAAELITQSARIGKLDSIFALAEKLITVRSGAVTDASHLIACARAATQSLFAGRLDLVDRLLAVIDRNPSEDPSVEGRAQWVHALRAHMGGDSVAYLETSVAAVANFEQAGDLRTACSARIDVGSAYLLLGAYDEAESALRAALKDAESMGLIPVRAVLEAHLGLCLALKDAFGEARALLERSVATFRAQNSRRAEGATGTYLALMLQRAGELVAAEQAARAALEVLSVAPLLRPQALGALASILLARGDAKGALVVAREAHEAVAAAGHVEEGEALVNLVLAESLSAVGDKDEAARAIEHARTHLLARAEKIRNERWRKSFLERVPEHARTLALAQTLRAV